METTRSMYSASTEYMMKSDIRDTWWPSTSTCTLGLSAANNDEHHVDVAERLAHPRI